jgi:hypothetical protein
MTDRVGNNSGCVVIDLYSEGICLGRLSGIMVLVVFFILSERMLGKYLQVGTTASFHNSTYALLMIIFSCHLVRYDKVVPVLSFLTEHHPMKAYWKSGGIAPRIL